MRNDRYRDRSRACPRGIRGHCRSITGNLKRSVTGASRPVRISAPRSGCCRSIPKLAALFEKYPPAHIAVEKLFFSKNITSAMSVSEARGVILLLAEQQQIPVTEYTPNQVKQAITGSGRADKRQMQEMIMRLLHLPEIPQPDDAADALSIALCHIHILR